MTIYEEQIFSQAKQVFGKEHQIIVAIEELSELQKELTKFLRGQENYKGISEEIADAEIVIDQLKLIFGNQKQVDEYRQFKVDRLLKKIIGEQKK
ncbi:MAG: hypothetical protein KBS62_00335 [Oscillospiraceae bacterium]|nr:hypothetical protein [Candidatus Ruminococcus equi]